MDETYRRIGYAWILLTAFVIGALVGNVTADPVIAAQEPAVKDDCFPRGFLVRTEKLGVVCIDSRVIRWDGNP